MCVIVLGVLFLSQFLVRSQALRMSTSGNNKKLGPRPQSDDVATENRWRGDYFWIICKYLQLCDNF